MDNIITIKKDKTLKFYISAFEDKMPPDLTLYVVKKDDSSVVYMSKDLSDNGRYKIKVLT